MSQPPDEDRLTLVPKEATPSPLPDEDRPPPPSPSRPSPPHPHFGWAVLWCIGMMLATMTPGIVAAIGYILIVAIFIPGAIDLNAISMENVHIQIGLGLGIWVPHVCIILMSLAVLRIVAGRDWPRQVALRLPSVYHFLLVLFLTPAVLVLADGIMLLLRDRLGLPTLFDPNKKMEGMGNVEDLLNSWPLAVALFVIAIMPALSEELWCRAFLGRGLVGIHGYVLGVLMTSFLFGLIHLDPCQGLMAVSMGIVLHFVYLTTRSLLAPMLLHFLNNAASVILSRWSAAFEPEGDSAALSYAAAALVLAAVAYAFYESRARLVATDGGIPWRPAYPGVACPPPGAGTVVIAPPPSLLAVFVVFVSLAEFGAVVARVVVGK